MLAIPGLWRLGLDQAAWIAIALVLGGYALSTRPSRRLLMLCCSFVAAIIVSGVLGAEGSRWLTLGRELVIVVAFFAAMLGVAALRRRLDRLQMLLVGVAFVLVASSAASILAFVTQKLFPFETPIANMIPAAIASTRLGELTFTDRSLGTWSYFLGTIFVRPQGLFLFSTSQAVAMAAAVPILMAAAVWYPALRWWFWFAAVLSGLALLITTTRASIAALVVCLLVAWLIHLLARGNLESTIRRHRAPLALAGVLFVALIGAAVVSGAGDSAIRAITARSLGPRAELYGATLDRWTERPVLGWGTEVDWVRGSGAGTTGGTAAAEDAANSPPLGSHSQYLGVLFKQGAVGFLVFAAIVAVVMGGIRRRLGERALGSTLVAAGVATTLISALTESLWLDPGTALVVAMTWGLVLGPQMRLPPSVVSITDHGALPRPHTTSTEVP